MRVQTGNIGDNNLTGSVASECDSNGSDLTRRSFIYISRLLARHSLRAEVCTRPLPRIAEHAKCEYLFKMATTQEEMAKLMANVTPWYKDPGRRKLYSLLLIALLSAATNGYDGYEDIPLIVNLL